MTYYDLIKNKLGDNETTARLMNYIATNAVDAIGNLFAYLDEAEFQTIKAAMTGEDSDKYSGTLNGMVEHVLKKVDVLAIPTDGQAPLFGRIGQLIAAVIKSNAQMFASEQSEPPTDESEDTGDEGVHDSEP